LCEEDGYQNCEEKWKDDAAQMTGCVSQTYDLCRITFGPYSRCHTQELVVTPGSLPELTAPELAPPTEAPPPPSVRPERPAIAPTIKE
jgi:hypothetical protein